LLLVRTQSGLETQSFGGHRDTETQRHKDTETPPFGGAAKRRVRPESDGNTSHS